MENDKIKLTYELPTSKDPNVFGSKYWQALHEISEKVPCEHCRSEAESFMKFFHDYINYKLGKPIYDKKNFINKINEISKLKQKPLILK